MAGGREKKRGRWVFYLSKKKPDDPGAIRPDQPLGEWRSRDSAYSAIMAGPVPSIRASPAGRKQQAPPSPIPSLPHRDPKIALPTRTHVAPQAIATSKSADMPIDTVV